MKIRTDAHKIIVTDTLYADRALYASIPGARRAKHEQAWYMPRSPVTAMRLRVLAIENKSSGFGEFGSDYREDDGYRDLMQDMRRIIDQQKYKDPSTNENAKEVSTDHWLTDTAPWGHQVTAGLFSEEKEACYLAMEMGPQPTTEPVLTPDGWTTIGEIRPGDLVIGADGRSCLVVETKTPWVDDVYEVKFKDGARVECTADHLWVVNTAARKFRGGSEKVLPLRALMDAGFQWKHGNRFHVQCVRPVQYPDMPLPFDPWLVGFIIGDCCLGHGSLRFTKQDRWQVDRVEECLPPELVISTLKGEDEYNIIGTGSMEGNPLLRWVREVGLDVPSRKKHIPEGYLRAAVCQRLALLRGLCDTDAHIEDGCCTVEWVTASERLCNGFIDLVQGLGGVASVSDKWVNGTCYYRVHFKTNQCPFSDPRKAEAWAAPTKYPPIRTMVSAKLLRSKRWVTCLRVQGGLYVTNGHVITHNTGKTLVIINEILEMIQAGGKDFLIICPKSVIDVWVDEFSKHCDDYDVTTFEVIALKQGTTKIKAAVLRDHDLYSKMPRVVIVNYESVWRNSLGDYILSQSWDMVVADEAHKIKSAGGKASRFCARLAGKAVYRRCLSGTPLPNNQLDAYGQWRFLDPGVFGTSFARFRARYAQMGGFQGYEIVGWHNQEEFKRLLDYLTFRVDKEVLDLPPITTTVRRCSIPPSTRRLYRQIEEEFIADVGGGTISMTNVLKRFTKLQQLSSGFIIDDDGNTISLHHEKSKLLTEFLESIDKDESVVVFCRFRRDLEEVRDVSVALGRSHGELSGRANDLEGGMLPASVNVLGVQIQAGGVGVNLTRARYCAFYSVGYSLADFLQAQARVHRGGQDRPVTYVHLIADNTMDDRVYKALAAKKEVIDEILAYIKREKR